MSHTVEAGGAAGRRRASGTVLARNIPEVIQDPVIVHQSAWIAARFNVGAAHARTLAELAFPKGTLR